jgi:hypothetical protein
MKKIGLLITSRNNYRFFDEFWAPRIQEHNSGYCVLNIDEDSNKKERALGIESCKRHGVVFKDREQRGMHHNLLTAADFFRPLGIEYIVWFQSDSWPLQDYFYDKLNDLVSTGWLDQFGVIGFNGIAQNILEQKNYDRMVKDLYKGKEPIGVIGRCPLSARSPWYCSLKTRRIKHPLRDPDKFRKPFAVESAAWFAAMIGIKRLRRDIDPSHEFYFHKSWDDIAYQCLVKNIYNITLPSFYADHRPDLKPESGLPERSVRFAYKGNDAYHSLVGFKPDEWKKQWGFVFDDRESFKKVRKKFKKNLLYRFYEHDSIEKGPLEVFDLP